jgi:ribose/xylose/arabinose/galactoside ABC-type transport system permease subunit
MKEQRIKHTAKKVFTRFNIFIIIIGFIIVVSILNPAFLTLTNLTNLLIQATVISIISFGMTYVIISGGIDLSVGSIVAFAGMVLGMALRANFPLILAILLCLLIGGICGFVNGILVSIGKVPPFVATLGMMSMARGLSLLIVGGRSISGFKRSFLFIANGEIIGIPLPILIMVIAFLAAMVILRLTIWGQYIYAIGGNIQAARLAGIRVGHYLTGAYVVSGLFAGLASTILTARLDSAQPVVGTLYELDSIAAAVIGGASLMGGKGSMEGTIVGSLALALLKNGLSIVNVSSYIQQILIGVIVVMAVLIDRIKK